MKALSIVLLLTWAISNNSVAQKFPFDIAPLASPLAVNAKKPIKHVSSEPFKSLEVYTFSTACVLQGITFNTVFLDFEDSKLTKMTFQIKSKQDGLTVIKALSSKYKKESSSNYDTPYCYRSGDILIYYIQMDKPDVVNNYGYLYYEYQASGSF
jgi:hypothetical protein